MGNLQEAYLSVYQELDELHKGRHGQSDKEYQAGRSNAGKRISGDENTGPNYYTKGRSRGATPDAPTAPGAKPVNTPKLSASEKEYHQYNKSGAKRRAEYSKVGGPKGLPEEEEFDLFDYLLEYLVAEGYADTNDNAIAIMANMSEDWRAEILDEAVRGSERSIADRITGNDIRGVTRGEKTVYKKPRSKDRAETQVRRDMGKEGHKTPYQHGSGLTKQAKASAERMNAIKNVEVKHDYDNHDVDVETTSSDSKSGYKTVPTDYRARKRRASGR